MAFFLSVSHLLIDRHFEHLVIFDGLEAEYESSVELLCRVAPEGGLVSIGEVDTAAAARMEHCDPSSLTLFLALALSVVAPQASLFPTGSLLSFSHVVYYCGL